MEMDNQRQTLGRATMNREPILHLAQRAVKQPESLRASEIKRMSEWVILAYKQRDKETGNLNPSGPTFTVEGSHMLEIGKW